MLRLASALALVASLSTGCIITTDDDSEFTIYNESSYLLEEIYIAENSQIGWGPNLVAGDVLRPGESLTIVDIECGTYDVLVTDDTGVDCELSNIDLCLGDSDGWVVDNVTLDICYENP